jgi:hypothetical protein
MTIEEARKLPVGAVLKHTGWNEIFIIIEKQWAGFTIRVRARPDQYSRLRLARIGPVSTPNFPQRQWHVPMPDMPAPTGHNVKGAADFWDQVKRIA